jgi:hypothetical protein
MAVQGRGDNGQGSQLTVKRSAKSGCITCKFGKEQQGVMPPVPATTGWMGQGTGGIGRAAALPRAPCIRIALTPNAIDASS